MFSSLTNLQLHHMDLNGLLLTNLARFQQKNELLAGIT